MLWCRLAVSRGRSIRVERQGLSRSQAFESPEACGRRGLSTMASVPAVTNDALSLASALINTSHLPLLLFDGELRAARASPAVWIAFGLRPSRPTAGLWPSWARANGKHPAIAAAAGERPPGPPRDRRLRDRPHTARPGSPPAGGERPGALVHKDRSERPRPTHHQRRHRGANPRSSRPMWRCCWRRTTCCASGKC